MQYYELWKTGRDPTGVESTENVKKEIFLQKSDINYTSTFDTLHFL